MSNSTKMSGPLAALILVAIVALGIWAIIAQSKSDHQYIERWAQENHYEIISIEKTVFDHGPFWMVDEHDRVYRVKIAGEDRLCYFWFGVLSSEQKWK